ncbi:hypothetical protein C8T65DRAFT_660180 [Cerioporus squamosus]|nr:hypothetical protein C8T65DRAFT_660180 [Cerioporus squamosus]
MSSLGLCSRTAPVPRLDASNTPSPESDFVLEVLLRFIHFEEPVLLDLDDIVDVLEAATKYEIHIAIQGLTKALPRFLDKDPLRVFSVGRRVFLADPSCVFKRASSTTQSSTAAEYPSPPSPSLKTHHACDLSRGTAYPAGSRHVVERVGGPSTPTAQGTCYMRLLSATLSAVPRWSLPLDWI